MAEKKPAKTTPKKKNPPVTPKGFRYGGRVKGTPNKNKDAFIERLNEAAIANGHEGFDILKEYTELYFDIKAENKEKASDMLGKVMEYAYPKKKAVEVTGEDGGPVEIDLSGAVKKFDDLMGAVS
jgi:hypothetical protein